MPEEIKPATTSPETTTAAPAPNPEPAKPIEMASRSVNKVTMMVAGVLVLLVVTAGAYAYSSGLFDQSSSAPAATNNVSTTEATTSDEVQALDNTATEVQTDIDDLNSNSQDLDNTDLSGDDTPAL